MKLTYPRHMALQAAAVTGVALAADNPLRDASFWITLAVTVLQAVMAALAHQRDMAGQKLDQK